MGKPIMPKKSELSDKQKLFCREYLVDLNATQAAIRAGYSKTTAKSTGSENLTKPAIQEQISKLKAKRAEKVDVKAEDLVRELAACAFGSLSDFITVNEDGLPRLDLSDATPEQMRTLTEIETHQYLDGDPKDPDRVLRAKIKRTDKLKALEMLGRHIGFFEVDNAQQNPMQEWLAEMAKRGSTAPVRN